VEHSQDDGVGTLSHLSPTWTSPIRETRTAVLTFASPIFHQVPTDVVAGWAAS